MGKVTGCLVSFSDPLLRLLVSVKCIASLPVCTLLHSCIPVSRDRAIARALLSAGRAQAPLSRLPLCAVRGQQAASHGCLTDRTNRAFFLHRGVRLGRESREVKLPACMAQLCSLASRVEPVVAYAVQPCGRAVHQQLTAEPRATVPFVRLLAVSVVFVTQSHTTAFAPHL